MTDKPTTDDRTPQKPAQEASREREQKTNYYADQAAMLTPSEFARMHRNQWEGTPQPEPQPETGGALYYRNVINGACSKVNDPALAHIVGEHWKPISEAEYLQYRSHEELKRLRKLNKPTYEQLEAQIASQQREIEKTVKEAVSNALIEEIKSHAKFEAMLPMYAEFRQEVDNQYAGSSGAFMGFEQWLAINCRSLTEKVKFQTEKRETAERENERLRELVGRAASKMYQSLENEEIIDELRKAAGDSNE